MTPAPDTRSRLLDAAEELFAEQGFQRTSVRQITSAAEANLAAVHYHFASKEGLVAEVFKRRLAPMNAERVRRLDEVLARIGDAPLPLRDVLEAFIAPVLTFGKKEGRVILTLVARAHVSPDAELRRIFMAQFEEIAQRYGEAFSRALPGVSFTELLWRVFFVIGAISHTILNMPMLTELSRGLCTGEDEDALLERLLDFATAGVATAADRPGPTEAPWSSSLHPPSDAAPPDEGGDR